MIDLNARARNVAETYEFNNHQPTGLDPQQLESLTRLIAAELRSVVEESKSQSNQMLSLLSYDLGRKDGNTEAYEDAARIAGDGCNDPNDGHQHTLCEQIAYEIRARAKEI